MEFVFIQNRSVNKGLALKIISDYFEVGLSDTIAFGDSINNDSPMLELSGCGVAIKNTSKPLQILADKATDRDNNEDGLGEYLRKIIKR